MLKQNRVRCVPPPGFAPEPSALAASQNEQGLSRLLVAFILVGLLHMLLPGTLAGVANLLTISTAHTANSAVANWVQSHGFAQIFGWIGSFILGIGFYSIPKLRGVRGITRLSGWITLAIWTVGLDLHWLSITYRWHWRVMMPLGAALQLFAFLIFFRMVMGHRANGKSKGSRVWIVAVASGSGGLLFALGMRLAVSLNAAVNGGSPILPAPSNLALLVVSTWGFMVPFIWGFSARWLPTFLGIPTPRNSFFLSAVGFNLASIVMGVTGRLKLFSILVAVAVVLSAIALRIFERPHQKAKTRGVHSSFPIFVRLTYSWTFVAVGLGIVAAFYDGDAAGIWGASRHALTVGFVATVVFTIGQRVLPAFAGMKHLFSTKMMFASLLLLSVGCAVRVTAEVLAYESILAGAWTWLPVSAILEMSAVSVFAVNLTVSLMRRGPQVNTLIEIPRRGITSTASPYEVGS